MAATLHFGKDQEKLHPAFGQLIKQINGDGKPRGYELNTANALWLQHDYHFLPDFLKLVHANYGAELREVDFKTATEQTRQTINGWVEKQTKDKIKELFKPGVLDPPQPAGADQCDLFQGQVGQAVHEDGHSSTSLSSSQPTRRSSTPMMRRKRRNFGY